MRYDIRSVICNDNYGNTYFGFNTQSPGKPGLAGLSLNFHRPLVKNRSMHCSEHRSTLISLHMALKIVPLSSSLARESCLSSSRITRVTGSNRNNPVAEITCTNKNFGFFLTGVDSTCCIGAERDRFPLLGAGACRRADICYQAISSIIRGLWIHRAP